MKPTSSQASDPVSPVHPRAPPHRASLKAPPLPQAPPLPAAPPPQAPPPGALRLTTLLLIAAIRTVLVAVATQREGHAEATGAALEIGGRARACKTHTSEVWEARVLASARDTTLQTDHQETGQVPGRWNAPWWPPFAEDLLRVRLAAEQFTGKVLLPSPPMVQKTPRRDKVPGCRAGGSFEV